jgi:hypothetical protein
MNTRAIKGTAAMVGVAVLLPALAACGGSSSNQSPASRSGTNGFPQSSEPSHLKPGDFTTRIDNPYFPLPVGARWSIRVLDDAGNVQRQAIRVTNRTKKIADGVTARVVHDVVSEHGKAVEITDDWYAQDKDGNVWYFGEDTAEFRGGKKDTSGAWQAGVKGADAGVAMPAHPEVGQSYREEYSKGNAEDRSKVLSLEEQAKVPFRHFRPTVMIRDYSPIEPDVDELKFYAKGVGQVLAVTVSGGSEKEELLRYTP